MIGDLVEFLQARLDEDEGAALDAARCSPSRSDRDAGQWHRDGANSVIDSSDRLVVYGDGPAPYGTQAKHIARHDPARALQEVEANRRILDAWVEAAEELNRHIEAGAPPQACFGTLHALGQVVKSVAAVHSDHPDYQPHWKP